MEKSRKYPGQSRSRWLEWMVKTKTPRAGLVTDRRDRHGRERSNAAERQLTQADPSRQVEPSIANESFGKTTLGAAIKEFTDERKDRSLTDNTMTMYRYSLKSLTKFLGIDVFVEDIALEDLRAFMRDQRRRGMSDKTLSTRRQNVRAFFAFLKEEEFIPTDPSLRIAKIKMARKKRVPMKIEEVQSVLDAFDRSTGLGLRNLILFLLMADTGARVTEIVSIEIANIDLEMHRIKIMGKGREERYLNLCPSTAREIRKYIRKYVAQRPEPSPYLFPNPEGKPITRHAAYKVVRRAAEAAGVDNVFPHRVRATFGSVYADDGGDTFALQQEMGHHDIRTTMGYVTVQEKKVHEKHTRYGLGPKLSLRRKPVRNTDDSGQHQDTNMETK